MMGPMMVGLIQSWMMRMIKCRMMVLVVLVLMWEQLADVDGLTSGKMIVNNMYRRRGASLLNNNNAGASLLNNNNAGASLLNNNNAFQDKIATKEYTRPARQSGTNQVRSPRQSGINRSPRQSGQFHLSPALRLLLARRQQWTQHSTEPQTDSSERVTVKQLPVSAPRVTRIAKASSQAKQLATPKAKQLATPISFPSGLDTFSFKEVARRQRQPQIHTFNLDTEDDAEILRGRFVEQPRASALLAPVQTILPEPIAAVPSRPVVFQRHQDVFQRPNLHGFPAVPAVPTVTPSTFNRQRGSATGTPFIQPQNDQTFPIGTRQPFRVAPEVASTTPFQLPLRDQDKTFEVRQPPSTSRQPTTSSRQQSTSRQRKPLTSTSRNPFLTPRKPQTPPTSRPLLEASAVNQPIAGQPSARPRLTAPRTSPSTFLPRSTPPTSERAQSFSSQRTFASRFSPSTFSSLEEERTLVASPAPTTSRARQPLPTRPQPIPTRPQPIPTRSQDSPSVFATRTERPRNRVTTKRPALIVTHVEATPAPTLGFVEDIDPCEDGNYQVIAGQPHRSFNHHLSVGTEPPICDRLLPTGWYRFESAAGNLLPTECPGGNYCGTQIPVWMKGTIPSVSEGVVRSTACINEDRECCVAELPMLVRNCSSWVAYHLKPTPGCNMGYCVGEGVPCPTGLASTNGYTPCDFPVKMRDVVLIQGTNQQHSEILFYCNPLLTDVIVPSTIEIDILWFVDSNNVFSETFNTQEQTVGILHEEYWKMGQTIHCSAQAKHSVVGARTKRIDSNKLFAGLKVVSAMPLLVQEGGAPALISLTSTVPVLCKPKDRAFAECCVSLEMAMTALDLPQRCPAGNIVDRAGLPNCLHKICQDDWNNTHHIPVYALEDHLHNGDQLLSVDIRTGFTASNQWRNYVLKPQKVRVLPSTVQEVCESDSSVFTFDSLRYLHKQQGTYILYRHRNLPQEVQVYYRRCNLRELCHCAVSIRDGDVMITLDICSRGYLQVWGLTRRGTLLTEDQLPQGLRFLSLNEGRAYEFYFSGGTYVTLGPYLSYIKVFASAKDLGATEGLCGTFDRNQANEFTSIDNNVLCSNTPFAECIEFTKSWLLRPRETLFAGFFRPITNDTESVVREKVCACKHTEDTLRKAAKLNEITTNRFFKAGSLDLKGRLQCEARQCDDNRAVSVLDEVLATVEDRDFERFTDVEELQLEKADSQFQVATVTVVGGPEQPRPKEGWTITTADAFCGEFIRGSVAVAKCSSMPGVDVNTAIKNCRNDVLYAGDTRYALLHLDRIKEDCRTAVTKNVSLWVVEPGSKIPLPPPDIVNALCLNDCSHNGLCNLGVCLCSPGWVGADCSIDLDSGPRVTSFSNNGLCDARTKPCKNLSVLGDNFANNEALTCHFEIFKIRGVASKQLVQDDVMSSSATFVSFQQVVCHLPNLDIHKNKEIHRFDLRDNTDQTRMFVKVSIAYGNGPPSAPLDLLLYDSQCWHCSIEGQCNANANDQCVFSAANSRVQTFRIGKSITTGEEEYLFCTLPHDSGSCDRKEFRYYYNSLERRCKLFVYGGCKGNQNNFLSETACVRRCGDADAVAALSNIDKVPQIEEIDQCRQVKDEGICPGNVPRFYFDDHAQRCLLFSYGGCGGNTNNFITEDECISTCGGPTGALAHAIGAHNGGLKPRKEICNLPINRGGCQAKLTRLFFDTDSGTCKLFVFGGCQGNENNFETMEDCVITCGGPVAAREPFTRIPILASTTTTRKPLLSLRQSTAASNVFIESTTALITTAASDNNIIFSPNALFTTKRKGISTTKATEVSFTSISLPNISPCGLPKQVGSCLSFSMRYYYDKEEKLCKKFRYSGCGGNGNNFHTGDNCVKNCGGKIGEFINENKNINERIVLPTMKRTTSTTNPPPTIPPPQKHQESKKRKMKRVRISARGRSRSRSSLESPEEAADSVASSSNVSVVRTRSRNDSARSRTRARSRIRSRTSSSSSLVSSSTEQSVSLRLADLDLPRFRRPSRTIADYAVQVLRREDGERIKGPRVDTSTRGHDTTRSHEANITRTYEKSRVGASTTTNTHEGLRVVPDTSMSKRVVGVATITRVSAPARGRIARNHTRYQTENTPHSEVSHSGVRRQRERVDEIMKSPPNMKGGLVVIRSYCRYPPLGVEEEVGCNDSTQLFFYNVSSAACEPFVGGMCKRSRNKFLTQQACVDSCVVDSQGLDIDDH